VEFLYPDLYHHVIGCCDLTSLFQVYVFDFGSELYLWQGKGATPNQRKVSLKLAQQLWSQDYDYSKCEVNPLSPLKSKGLRT